MARIHYFHEIYLHINWHCHRDLPMISPHMEPFLHGEIEALCRKEAGVFFKAIGGIYTHIHLAIQITPSVHIDELIGRLKGASSHEMNERFGKQALHWQRGYGIVSFAGLNLPAIQSYIRNQKLHHAKGRGLKRLLERVDENAPEVEARL